MFQDIPTKKNDYLPCSFKGLVIRKETPYILKKLNLYALKSLIPV